MVQSASESAGNIHGLVPSDPWSRVRVGEVRRVVNGGLELDMFSDSEGITGSADDLKRAAACVP